MRTCSNDAARVSCSFAVVRVNPKVDRGARHVSPSAGLPTHTASLLCVLQGQICLRHFPVANVTAHSWIAACRCVSPLSDGYWFPSHANESDVESMTVSLSSTLRRIRFSESWSSIRWRGTSTVRRKTFDFETSHTTWIDSQARLPRSSRTPCRQASAPPASSSFRSQSPTPGRAASLSP